MLGPGLVTGASDDDPSGVATYAQAGATFGTGMLWTAPVTLPLMIAVQEICDRVGVINDGRLQRESTVAELRGGTTLRVRGLPVDRALAIAMRIAGDDGVRVDGEHLLLELPADRAPEVTRALVADGVDVLEVSAGERTLEEVFFEMTGPLAADLQTDEKETVT